MSAARVDGEGMTEEAQRKLWATEMVANSPDSVWIALAVELLRAGRPDDVAEDGSVWLVLYADRDMASEYFAGVGAEGAARARFEVIDQTELLAYRRIARAALAHDGEAGR